MYCGNRGGHGGPDAATANGMSMKASSPADCAQKVHNNPLCGSDFSYSYIRSDFPDYDGGDTWLGLEAPFAVGDMTCDCAPKGSVCTETSIGSDDFRVFRITGGLCADGQGRGAEGGWICHGVAVVRLVPGEELSQSPIRNRACAPPARLSCCRRAGTGAATCLGAGVTAFGSSLGVFPSPLSASSSLPARFAACACSDPPALPPAFALPVHRTAYAHMCPAAVAAKETNISSPSPASVVAALKSRTTSTRPDRTTWSSRATRGRCSGPSTTDASPRLPRRKQELQTTW